MFSGPQPHHNSCPQFQETHEGMTDSEKRWRDIGLCANEGAHEKCAECFAARAYGVKGPGIYQTKGYSSPF